MGMFDRSLSFWPSRGQLVELSAASFASLAMAVMVLAGGHSVGRVPATAPITAPAAPAHATPSSDTDVDAQDATLTTRRKAAIRAIERQWLGENGADVPPVTPTAAASATPRQSE
jgi:hypothetical protein